MTATRPSRVLRNRWTASFGALAVLGVAAMAVFAAVDRGVNGINEAVPTRWFGSAVVLTVASFIWHVGIRPSIVVEPWGLRVRNPVFVHRLPWEAITGCGVSPSGAMTISTVTGTVHPFTYAGSLAAALGGAHSARSALRVIEDARSTHEPGADPGMPSTRFSLVVAPLLVAWLLAGAVAALA